MSRNAKTLASGHLAAEALEQMEKNKISSLVVVDSKDQVKGPKSQHVRDPVAAASFWPSHGSCENTAAVAEHCVLRSADVLEMCWRCVGKESRSCGHIPVAEHRAIERSKCDREGGDGNRPWGSPAE